MSFARLEGNGWGLNKKLVKEEVQAIKRRPSNKTNQQNIAPKPLTESQLQIREAVLVNQVAKDLKNLGVAETAAHKFFSDADDRAAAFHMGVLIGLRAALGYNPKITL